MQMYMLSKQTFEIITLYTYIFSNNNNNNLIKILQT